MQEKFYYSASIVGCNIYLNRTDKYQLGSVQACWTLTIRESAGNGFALFRQSAFSQLAKKGNSLKIMFFDHSGDDAGNCKDRKHQQDQCCVVHVLTSFLF